jgi:hypothetical protein
MHELAQALVGREDVTLTYAQEELVVESAIFSPRQEQSSETGWLRASVTGVTEGREAPAGWQEAKSTLSPDQGHRQLNDSSGAERTIERARFPRAFQALGGTAAMIYGSVKVGLSPTSGRSLRVVRMRAR